MSDLADWLLEQIAADEEVARDAWSGPWATTHSGSVDFLRRWDPARVLAECAAKRAIVQEWLDHRAAINGEGVAAAMTPQDVISFEGHGHALEYVLRLLAQPYRDRDGYRQEWDVQ